MNAINDPRVYMRSMATRENNVSVSPFIHSALNVLKLAHPDVIILETSGSDNPVQKFLILQMFQCM
jgi:methylmalonyl-CoA mutase